MEVYNFFRFELVYQFWKLKYYIHLLWKQIMVPDFLMFFKVFSCSVLAESKPGSLIDSRGQKLWFWYNRRSGFRFSRRLRPCTFFYHVISVTFGHFWAKQRPYLDSTQNLGGKGFLLIFDFPLKKSQGNTLSIVYES